MEQRKLRRNLPSKVRRRSQNVVARQHDSEARSKLQGKVNRIRHRITINVYDSSRRRLVADPQVKHAVKEKECRAHMVNRPRNNNSSSSRSTAAPRPQPITASHKDTQRVGNKKEKNQHRRRGHNEFSKAIVAASL